MEQLIFSRQSEEEILEKIKKKAESYTPEWRFDRECPDIGTVLSLIFSHMLAGTYKKLDLLPMKNKIAFFNQLGASMLPAVPSRGWVSFFPVNKEGLGQEVLAGTQVICQDNEGRKLFFETSDDLLVTGALLKKVLFSCPKRDFIGEAYSGEGPLENVKLFFAEGENLQEHILYFSAGKVLEIKSQGEISIRFFLRDKAVDIERIFSFEYSTSGGYQRLNNVKLSDGEISFMLTKEDPPFEMREEMGHRGYWMRLRVKDYKPFENFSFDRMVLSSSCKKARPEMIFAEGEEALWDEFSPFGQRFTNYSEAYIASEEVFGKKGSEITVSFYMEFEKTPLDETEEEPKELEWIMKKSGFKRDLKYDITIEEVVWEYYNGRGWAVIPGTDAGRCFFSIGENGREGEYKKLSFTCPEDLAPILINSKESYFIRIRVLSVNNLFKPNGSYIYPVIKNLCLSYDYEKALTQADYIFSLNNREIREVKPSLKGKRQQFFPFYGLREENPALYFGFDRPFGNGPVKIMFDAAERKNWRDRSLLWEYYNGISWKELDVVDETENFSRPGIVTILASREIKKLKLYGNENYWLRVSDISWVGIAGEKEDKQLPVIRSIYLNSVKVCCKSPGGEHTNAGEGKLDQLGKSLRYIRRVTNPKKMTGGSDSESPEEALKRNAGIIRHQNRAITVRDFEEIAKNADRTIHKVKCIRGYDENEEKRSGALTLLVLLKNYQDKGAEFYNIKLLIENYLKDRINSLIWDLNQLYISEPHFIELNVSAEIAAEGMEEVFRVKKQALKRLKEFLDPISGNFDNSGWDIGVIPNMMQLKNAISGIEGIKYIRNLFVTAYLKEGSSRREVDFNSIMKSRYILPVSGSHDIIISI